MIHSEALRTSSRSLNELRSLVRQGEGLHLEFKRKAAHPEKIVREIIAFANTDGGVLLIGVSDDGTIPGVRYPEEELVMMQKAFEEFCRPQIRLTESIIPVSDKKFVVRFDVPSNGNKPHFFVAPPSSRECYVRVRDMSLKASKEVTEIVRRSQKKKDIQFTFGDAEKKLMAHLDEKEHITLDEFRKVARLSRYMAARKLILLVLANVLSVTPSEVGDIYRRRS